jgi:hypothetical protein
VEEVIEALQAAHQTVAVGLAKPSLDDVVEVQEAMLLPIPDDYRTFLLQTGEIVCGYLEPNVIADPSAYNYLPEVAAKWWDLGLERHLLPICETGEQVYVVDPEGEVSLWPNAEAGPWPNIWHWARDIWLAGAQY